jgi:hypothetical protein
MLFHFSEDPSIKEFVPLSKQSVTDMSPVVWAIDEEHSVNYLFPRDCPRIIFSRSANMSKSDKQLFFSQTAANTIMTVESAWLDRMMSTTIYKYTFETAGFELYDQTAGYYINHSIVQPISVEPITNLLGVLSSKGIELRITPNLYPLRNAILNSTISDFSMIRLRNAQLL